MKRLWLGLAVLLVAIAARCLFRDGPSGRVGFPLVAVPASPVQAPTVEITYIANEGVLDFIGRQTGSD